MSTFWSIVVTMIDHDLEDFQDVQFYFVRLKIIKIFRLMLDRKQSVRTSSTGRRQTK